MEICCIKGAYMNKSKRFCKYYHIKYRLKLLQLIWWKPVCLKEVPLRLTFQVFLLRECPYCEICTIKSTEQNTNNFDESSLSGSV